MNREGVVAFMRQCQHRVHGGDDSNLNEILASLETFLDDPGLGFKGIVQFDSRPEHTPRVTGSPLVMGASLPGRK